MFNLIKEFLAKTPKELKGKSDYDQEKDNSTSDILTDLVNKQAGKQTTYRANLFVYFADTDSSYISWTCPLVEVPSTAQDAINKFDEFYKWYINGDTELYEFMYDTGVTVLKRSEIKRVNIYHEKVYK